MRPLRYNPRFVGLSCLFSRTWQPQTMSWRVAGMRERPERGPGSDQLTMVKKRTRVTIAEFSPTLSLLENTSFLLSDLHLNLNPSCSFVRYSTRWILRWMSRSWLYDKVTFCFGSGALMAIVSGFVLPKDWSSTMLSFKLLSWEHRRSSKYGTSRIAPDVTIAP